jgi:hypothetical protein
MFNTAPPPQITGEQLALSPYTANLNDYISIWGTNFCSNPQVNLGGVFQFVSYAGSNQIWAGVAVLQRVRSSSSLA